MDLCDNLCILNQENDWFKNATAWPGTTSIHVWLKLSANANTLALFLKTKLNCGDDTEAIYIYIGVKN